MLSVLSTSALASASLIPSFFFFLLQMPSGEAAGASDGRWQRCTTRLAGSSVSADSLEHGLQLILAFARLLCLLKGGQLHALAEWMRRQAG